MTMLPVMPKPPATGKWDTPMPGQLDDAETATYLCRAIQLSYRAVDDRGSSAVSTYSAER